MIFLVFIFFVLMVDLVSVGRKVQVISAKEAFIWSIMWIGIGIGFYLVANMVNKFRFLKPGVSLLLVFVGLKLLIHHKLKSWGFQPGFISSHL